MSQYSYSQYIVVCQCLAGRGYVPSWYLSADLQRFGIEQTEQRLAGLYPVPGRHHYRGDGARKRGSDQRALDIERRAICQRSRLDQ